MTSRPERSVHGHSGQMESGRPRVSRRGPGPQRSRHRLFERAPPRACEVSPSWLRSAPARAPISLPQDPWLIASGTCNSVPRPSPAPGSHIPARYAGKHGVDEGRPEAERRRHSPTVRGRWGGRAWGTERWEAAAVTGDGGTGTKWARFRTQHRSRRYCACLPVGLGRFPEGVGLLWSWSGEGRGGIQGVAERRYRFVLFFFSSPPLCFGRVLFGDHQL